ncbi:MAG: NTP transferase domain-containing protein [Brevundimonas sp.]
MIEFDAVVLAGGAGSRLGGVSKADVLVGGVPLLDRVLAGLSGAARVVVVGPPDVARPDVLRVQESPPGGGPVAGLAAGLAVGQSPFVVALACDAPRAPLAVPALLAALDGDGDGARLVADGRPQHLVAVYRREALVGAFERLGDPSGASMRALVHGLAVVDIPDVDDLAADADTWPEVRRLDARLRGTIEP